MSQIVDTLDHLFDDFSESAIRIEARDSYHVDREQGPFAQFLAGDEPGPEWMREWTQFVGDRTSKGVRFARVRITGRPPFTDYRRFDLYNCRHNVAAGEDIRYLYRDHAASMALPLYDYWLFDDRTLALLGYDAQGRLNAVDVVRDPAVLTQHRQWFDAAQNAAIPWSRFVEQAR